MRIKPALLVASIVGCGACNATYGPLVRAAAYGAPGRLDAGRLELSASAGGLSIPQVVVPHVAYGVTDWLAVEGGANLAPCEWYLGFGGVRFSLVPHRRAPVHFVGDLELGGGGGVGGALYSNAAPSSMDCTKCDGRSATDRAAGGAYQGVGVGLEIAWFTPFLRLRVEESAATNVPVTLWPSAMLGFEFDLHRVAALTFGGGFMAYSNRIDSEVGWFYQFGVTFFIDTRREPN